jgi:hypothetical protein
MLAVLALAVVPLFVVAYSLLRSHMRSRRKLFGARARDRRFI